MKKIIGDIGGTYVRLAIAYGNGAFAEVEKLEKKRFSDVAEALCYYVWRFGLEGMEAKLAVNSIIIRGKPGLAQNDWGYDDPDILVKTGLTKITYVNDLAAQASAIPYLPDEYILPAFEAKEKFPKGNIVVIGPGTGLGLAYGTWNEATGKYDFHASEGGWVTVSAHDQYLSSLLKDFIGQYQQPPFGDHIISGRGIANLYDLFYSERLNPVEIMENLKNSGMSQRVFEVFCCFLGSFTRNAAVTFLPEGGIYFVGGMLDKDISRKRLFESEFMKYYNIGTTDYIKDYPMYFIDLNDLGLYGLANG